MVINYFKHPASNAVTTTFHDSISTSYPNVHCYARWNYCKGNGVTNGFANSDWSSPGAYKEEMQAALSSEGIQSHFLTGYQLENNASGTGINNIQAAIDQKKICIVTVVLREYQSDYAPGSQNWTNWKTDNPDWKSMTHWVVVYGYDDDYFYLNDPGYKSSLVNGKWKGQGYKSPKSQFAAAMWDVSGTSEAIVVDSVFPSVNSFDVQPRSCSAGQQVVITYSVSTPSGSSLQQVELWRTTNQSNWSSPPNPIQTTPISGLSHSGQFADTLSSTGTYWYGLHVTNNTYWATEQTSIQVNVSNIQSGASKIAAYYNGTWYLDYNGTGAWNGAVTDKQYSFGNASMKPVSGNWNGTGGTEIGAYYNGTWYLDYNGNGVWNGPSTDRQYSFGNASMKPVTGDWNSDGKTEIGCYYNGMWYLDYNGNGAWNGNGTGVGNDRQYSFGSAAMTPVTGDWDKDGITEIGCYYNGTWYLDYNGNGAWNGASGKGDVLFNFGDASMKPVTGDWNGDGYTDIGSYYNGTWYLDYNHTGHWDGPGMDRQYKFGSASMTPVNGAAY